MRAEPKAVTVSGVTHGARERLALLVSETQSHRNVFTKNSQERLLPHTYKSIYMYLHLGRPPFSAAAAITR